MNNKLNKSKSIYILLFLFLILLFIFWYIRSINIDYGKLEIDNVIYVDQDNGFITAYTGQDTLRIYYSRKGHHQLSFNVTDTFKIIKNRKTEKELTLYRESITIDTSKFLFYDNRMKILDNSYQLKTKYDRYVYRDRCQETLDNNQLKIEDFLKKDDYSMQEYSNIRYKYYEIIDKECIDKYYIFTSNDLDLFLTKKLCGIRDMDKKYSYDSELSKFNCDDCYCYSYYDTLKYDVLFTNTIGVNHIDYYNINYSKFSKKYPFGTIRPFFKQCVLDTLNKKTVSDFKIHLNDKKSNRNIMITKKGLMTNRISGDTLIIYFETNDSKLEHNDVNDIKKFISYYTSSNEKNKKSLGVCINGYSDKRGDKKVNYELSKNRANTVQKFLLNNGVPTIHVFYYGETKARVNSLADIETIKDRKVEIVFPFSIRNVLDKSYADYYILDGSKSMKELLPGSDYYTKWEEIANYPFSDSSTVFVINSFSDYNIRDSNNVNHQSILSYIPKESTPLLIGIKNIISIVKPKSVIRVLSDGDDNWGGVKVQKIINDANKKEITINISSIKDNSVEINQDLNNSLQEELKLLSISTNGEYSNLNTDDNPHILSKIPNDSNDTSELYSKENFFQLRFLSKDTLGNGYYIESYHPFKAMDSALSNEFREWVEYNFERMNFNNRTGIKRSDYVGQLQKDKIYSETHYPYYDEKDGVKYMNVINDFTKYARRYWYLLENDLKEDLEKDFRLQRNNGKWKMIYKYRLIENLIEAYSNSRDNLVLNKIEDSYHEIFAKHANNPDIKYFYLQRALFYCNNEDSEKAYKDIQKMIKIDSKFGSGYYLMYVWYDFFAKDKVKASLYLEWAKNYGCYDFPNYYHN